MLSMAALLIPLEGWSFVVSTFPSTMATEEPLSTENVALGSVEKSRVLLRVIAGTFEEVRGVAHASSLLLNKALSCAT